MCERQYDENGWRVTVWRDSCVCVICKCDSLCDICLWLIFQGFMYARQYEEMSETSRHSLSVSRHTESVGKSLCVLTLSVCGEVSDRAGLIRMRDLYARLLL